MKSPKIYRSFPFRKKTFFEEYWKEILFVALAWAGFVVSVYIGVKAEK